MVGYRHKSEREDVTMPLSKYVSAQWTTPLPGGDPQIKAIGDDGLEYFVPAWNTDVPPWPDYIINGGSIAPADEPESPPEEPDEAA